MFNSGKRFLFIRLSSLSIEAVGPGEVMFGRVLPGLDDASGGARGICGSGKIPDVLRVYQGGLGDGSSWFVGMGVSGL
jgi:hypothetical protein